MPLFLRLIATTLLLSAVPIAHAQIAQSTKTAEKKDEESGSKLPPLPADKTIAKTSRTGGREIRYNATVGHVPVRYVKGKVIGEVVYTVYTLPGGGLGRPVTFAFKGRGGCILGLS